MKTLAKKTEKSLLFTIEMIVGMVILVGAVVVLPVGVFTIDETFITNAYIWGTVIICMLLFGAVAFVFFIRPFYIFRKVPAIQAQTDGMYLYINSTKEAKIPLSDLEGMSVESVRPYVIGIELIIHLLSERFGNVVIKIPGHGRYVLYFVAGADKVYSDLMELAAGRTE